MAGLGLAQSLRLVTEEPKPQFTEGQDVVLNDEEASPDDLRIENDDGSVTLSINGAPLVVRDNEDDNPSWFRNLASKIPEGELNSIADDLLIGISEDEESRKEWLEDRASGIRLLALKLEQQKAGTDASPAEGMSKVRHPLLLEATLRFHANACGELLPTDGPVKIRNDSNDSTLSLDQLAQAYQKDFNHYLTTTAREYYPDTERMLLMVGFGGVGFKKVYHCPLRNRPVSISVDAEDLIVNQSATDLQTALRVTHDSSMSESQVRKFQLVGHYLDIDLGDARQEPINSAKRERLEQQGIRINDLRHQDRERQIYECYCELDLEQFPHYFNKKKTGLQVPYRVTIDASSRRVLSLVRDYRKDPTRLPERRQTFVKYEFVPGLGFYGIGLLHILGNTTAAVTAAWREMLDAGMFANFPGFLFSDLGGRQDTNIFRVQPGGGAQVRTGGAPISHVVQPLPYKEPGPAMMNLVQNMVETGQRVGGTAELAVGEGRQDAPVGTTLAMIDQATKVVSAVHKRLHTSQSIEFELLVDCFKENPESFWQRNRRPATPWDQQTFMKAVNSWELIPRADPNTSSQTQRIMKIVGLKELQKASPTLYDPIAIDRAALIAMGWSNPEEFMAPPEAQGRPTPEVQEKMAKAAIEKQDADTRLLKVQSDIANAQQKTEIERQGLGLQQAEIDLQEQQLGLNAIEVMKPDQPEAEDPFRELEAKAKLIMAEARRMDADVKQFDAVVDAENRERDRESRERLALTKIVQDDLKNKDTEGGNKKSPLADEIMTDEFINKLKENG